jgi:hypothetical protein
MTVMASTFLQTPPCTGLEMGVGTGQRHLLGSRAIFIEGISGVIKYRNIVLKSNNVGTNSRTCILIIPFYDLCWLFPMFFLLIY